MSSTSRQCSPPPEPGAPPAHPQGVPSAGRGPGQEAVLPASCPNRRRHELPPRFSAPTGFPALFPSWFHRGHCQALRTRPRARASGGIHRDDPLPLCPVRGPQIPGRVPDLRLGAGSPPAWFRGETGLRGRAFWAETHTRLTLRPLTGFTVGRQSLSPGDPGRRGRNDEAAASSFPSPADAGSPRSSPPEVCPPTSSPAGSEFPGARAPAERDPRRRSRGSARVRADLDNAERSAPPIWETEASSQSNRGSDPAEPPSTRPGRSRRSPGGRLGPGLARLGHCPPLRPLAAATRVMEAPPAGASAGRERGDCKQAEGPAGTLSTLLTCQRLKGPGRPGGGAGGWGRDLRIYTPYRGLLAQIAPARRRPPLCAPGAPFAWEKESKVVPPGTHPTCSCLSQT